MEIVRVNTDQLGFSKAYVTLFNGTLKLTARELDLLSSILDKYLEFREEGLKEPFLSKFVFSAETKKEVQETLGLQTQHFQNILSGLVKKGVLLSEGSGRYTILPHIIPKKEIGFKFG